MPHVLVKLYLESINTYVPLELKCGIKMAAFPRCNSYAQCVRSLHVERFGGKVKIKLMAREVAHERRCNVPRIWLVDSNVQQDQRL